MLKTQYDIVIQWRSFELRPPGSPPIPPAYMQRINESRPRFVETAKQLHGIDVKIGPFGINSRPALILAKYAELQGEAHGKAFHDAVMRSYWREAKDISDYALLQSLLVEAGLPDVEISLIINDPRYRDPMLADVETAHEIGLTGVPALIFNEKYLVSGAQPTDVLANVIEKVQTLGAATE